MAVKTATEMMRHEWDKMRKKVKPLVFAAHGSDCRSCGAKADTIDHIIPISRGGTNDFVNLRPMCRPCNARKKNHILQ